MPERSALLNEVFQRHYPDLVAWCRRRVRADLGDPEDFVHLAYLRCKRGWDAERCSKGNQSAFLFRALRWVVLDAVRKYLREQARRWQLPNRENAPPGIALRQAIVREALLSLRGRQLQVCLALAAGKTKAQICGELNLTPGALAVHTCRAKAALCAWLEVA